MCPQVEQQNQSRTTGLSVIVSELAQRGHTTTSLGEGPVITIV